MAHCRFRELFVGGLREGRPIIFGRAVELLAVCMWRSRILHGGVQGVAAALVDAGAVDRASLQVQHRAAASAGLLCLVLQQIRWRDSRDLLNILAYINSGRLHSTFDLLNHFPILWPRWFFACDI